jgi:hypothetical protein
MNPMDALLYGRSVQRIFEEKKAFTNLNLGLVFIYISLG